MSFNQIAFFINIPRYPFYCYVQYQTKNYTSKVLPVFELSLANSINRITSAASAPEAGSSP